MSDMVVVRIQESRIAGRSMRMNIVNNEVPTSVGSCRISEYAPSLYVGRTLPTE